MDKKKINKYTAKELKMLKSELERDRQEQSSYYREVCRALNRKKNK